MLQRVTPKPNVLNAADINRIKQDFVLFKNNVQGKKTHNENIGGMGF